MLDSVSSQKFTFTALQSECWFKTWYPLIISDTKTSWVAGWSFSFTFRHSISDGQGLKEGFWLSPSIAAGFLPMDFKSNSPKLSSRSLRNLRKFKYLLSNLWLKTAPCLWGKNMLLRMLQQTSAYLSNHSLSFKRKMLTAGNKEQHNKH